MTLCKTRALSSCFIGVGPSQNVWGIACHSRCAWPGTVAPLEAMGSAGVGQLLENLGAEVISQNKVPLENSSVVAVMTIMFLQRIITSKMEYNVVHFVRRRGCRRSQPA